MADIARWDPFQELERLREGLLGQSPWGSGWFPPLRFPAPEGWGSSTPPPWGPAIDVKETASDIIVQAEIPGIDPDDVEAIVEEGGLTLRGEVRRESSQTDGGYQRVERRYGRFHRAIAFPAPVKPDQAVAHYRDGILEIRAPKAGPDQTRGRKLKIIRDGTTHIH